MNRGLTNKIRFLLDECVPSVIRDSRWFMWPFFYVSYRGKNIRQTMDFKRHIYNWSEEEVRTFYEGIDSISRNRDSDLAPSHLRYILALPLNDYSNLVDIGCGKGFLLKKIREAFPQLSLSGFDLVNVLQDKSISFTQGSVTHLPFADNSFDVVICSHTIEHIVDLPLAIAELKRVTRKKLIIITPKQRYFFYTLDEHVNFFPRQELLTQLIDMNNSECRLLDGDWIYIGNK